MNIFSSPRSRASPLISCVFLTVFSHKGTKQQSLIATFKWVINFREKLLFYIGKTLGGVVIPWELMITAWKHVLLNTWLLRSNLTIIFFTYIHFLKCALPMRSPITQNLQEIERTILLHAIVVDGLLIWLHFMAVKRFLRYYFREVHENNRLFQLSQLNFSLKG